MPQFADQSTVMLGQWRLDARAEVLSQLRRRLLEVVADLGVDVFAVMQAVTEAATNVVVHAYPDGVGELRVLAIRAGGELRLTVADDGVGARGFDHPSRNAGLGLGMPLIRSCADRVRISHPGQGTSVQMTFRIERP